MMGRGVKERKTNESGCTRILTEVIVRSVRRSAGEPGISNSLLTTMTGRGKVDTEKPTVPKKPYTRAAARNPNNPNSPDNGVGSPQLLFDSHGVPTNLLANRQGIDLVANPGLAPYIPIPSNIRPFGQQEPGSIGYDKREALIAQETLKRKQQDDVAMQDEGAQRRPPPANPQFLLPAGSNAAGWGDGG